MNDRNLLIAAVVTIFAALFLLTAVASAQPVDGGVAEEESIAEKKAEEPKEEKKEEPKEVPNPDENLGGTIQMLVEAFQGGNWFAAGAIIVLLIVWSIGKFLKPGSEWLPLIAAAVGMLLGLASSLVANNVEWYVALYKGLTTGGSAALFWSILGKKIFPKYEAEQPSTG